MAWVVSSDSVCHQVHGDDSAVESRWTQPEFVGAVLCVIQAPFWTYLVWVSWKNLMKMYDEASDDIHKRTIRDRELMKMQSGVGAAAALMLTAALIKS